MILLSLKEAVEGKNISNEYSTDIEERINSIREAIQMTSSEYDKEKLQERLGRLTGKNRD